MPNFVKVASASDLKPGEGKVVYVNDTEIALFNVGGNFFAIDNKCKHKGGPLGDGNLDGNVVTCPWHGWKYNVETGSNLVMQNIKVDSYKVKVEDSNVFIELG